MNGPLPRYDWRQSYEWNYQHAPKPVEMEIPCVPGVWTFCGLPVDSPLGVPAGPLLNGDWCLYYASLGFDVLTYKTVRSASRKCYEMPNLQPVSCPQMSAGGTTVQSMEEMEGSWAVSFGMPSQDPEIWRQDVEKTRAKLPAGKLLCVSVVGTVQPGWSIDQLADDYAQCAAWAVESGADAVEANFSCPNVSTCDGQLYQMPDDAKVVAERVRAAVAGIPFLIKIGHLSSISEMDDLLDAVGGAADALAMTNSIAARVQTDAGSPLFGGELRGICGEAILDESVRQVARFKERMNSLGRQLELVAVGGVSSGLDAVKYCQAGAHAVHVATAAMCAPEVGIEIRQTLASTAIARC